MTPDRAICARFVLAGMVCVMVSRSEIRYARSGDAHVAYRVVGAGEGGRDVVFVTGGTMPMDSMLDDAVALRFLDGLTEVGRLVVFDRRGIGLSDPPTDWLGQTIERWCDDLEAVVAAAQIARPVLVGSMLGASPTVLYCDRHPKDVTSMVLVEPVSPFPLEHGHIRGQIEGEIDSVPIVCPSRANEPGFREWFNRAGQLGASPGMAERSYAQGTEDEIHSFWAAALRLRVPTLVLRRPASRFSPPSASDPFLTLVPGAIRIDLPGEDLAHFGGEVDALLAEIAHFVTGERRAPTPERLLAAVLYTDLVASTDRATSVGDARWKHVLDRHDEVSRACIGRRGGTVIKTTGDGILAIVPSAANAFRAARELRTALLEEDLEVRVGIHVGDIDRRGDDISGIGVVIAARLLGLATPGEILASSVAVGATTGEPITFVPRGEHNLKGVPGTWPLFTMTASTPTSRP